MKDLLSSTGMQYATGTAAGEGNYTLSGWNSNYNSTYPQFLYGHVSYNIYDKVTNSIMTTLNMMRFLGATGGLRVKDYNNGVLVATYNLGGGQTLQSWDLNTRSVYRKVELFNDNIPDGDQTPSSLVMEYGTIDPTVGAVVKSTISEEWTEGTVPLQNMFHAPITIATLDRPLVTPALQRSYFKIRFESRDTGVKFMARCWVKIENFKFTLSNPVGSYDSPILNYFIESQDGKVLLTSGFINYKHNISLTSSDVVDLSGVWLSGYVSLGARVQSDPNYIEGRMPFGASPTSITGLRLRLAKWDAYELLKVSRTFGLTCNGKVEVRTFHA